MIRGFERKEGRYHLFLDNTLGLQEQDIRNILERTGLIRPTTNIMVQFKTQNDVLITLMSGERILSHQEICELERDIHHEEYSRSLRKRSGRFFSEK